jgi:hypothetical protein
MLFIPSRLSLLSSMILSSRRTIYRVLTKWIAWVEPIP